MLYLFVRRCLQRPSPQRLRPFNALSAITTVSSSYSTTGYPGWFLIACSGYCIQRHGVIIGRGFFFSMRAPSTRTASSLNWGNSLWSIKLVYCKLKRISYKNNLHPEWADQRNQPVILSLCWVAGNLVFQNMASEHNRSAKTGITFCTFSPKYTASSPPYSGLPVFIQIRNHAQFAGIIILNLSRCRLQNAPFSKQA